MPAYARRTIAGQLNAARVAICNTRADGELWARVEGYGYTAARLDEGQRLLDAAAAAVNAQVAAVGEQRLATARAHAAERRARASYQRLAQLARVVYQREHGLRAALGLAGETPRGTVGFLAAANTLFANALDTPSIAEALAGYGYDGARLAREGEAVRAFERAYGAQVAAIAEARQATREQRVALAALNRWVARYLGVARIALHDQPALIEKLGLAAPRRARQEV